MDSIPKNGSTNSKYFHPYLLERVDEVKVVLLSFMLAACLFGNILIVTAISKTRKLRTASNILLVNLAICDVLTAVSAIPFTLFLYRNHDNDGAKPTPEIIRPYPFGVIGCKILWPFTTYAFNCSIFTLATIAIDRYLNISSTSFKFTKRRINTVLLTLHILAVLTVIPYSINFKHVTVNSLGYCYEEWYHEWQKKGYIVSLFIVQYALPLAIMAFCYSLAWWKIYKKNRTVIKMSEEYEKKISSMGFTPKIPKHLGLKMARKKQSYSAIVTRFTSTTRNTRRHNSSYVNRLLKRTDTTERRLCGYRTNKRSHAGCTRLMIAMQKEYVLRTTSRRCSSADKRERRRFSKSPYSSQAAYFRSRQSVKILRMFTVCVIVFGCFALPNQLHWLLQDYSNIPPIVSDIFILLTYVSSIVNCWIYSGFDNRIRKAYVQILCCTSYQAVKYGTYTSASTSPSLYDSRQEAFFHMRKTSFNRMFEQNNNRNNLIRIPLRRVSERNSEHIVPDSIDSSSTDES